MMVLVFIGFKISMRVVTIVSNKLVFSSHLCTQSIIAIRLISSRYFHGRRLVVCCLLTLLQICSLGSYVDTAAGL